MVSLTVADGDRRLRQHCLTLIHEPNFFLSDVDRKVQVQLANDATSKENAMLLIRGKGQRLGAKLKMDYSF